MQVDYLIQGSTNRIIKVRAKEDNFRQVIHMRVDIDGCVTWKMRGFAKMVDPLDDIAAMEKVICDMLTETTGLTKEQLGDIPLELAEGAWWRGGEMTIGTVK